MSISFIEKYALELQPVASIRSELNLEVKEFYELEKSLTEEIKIARKVRQLYLRKGFKKIPVIDFYHWWIGQVKQCKYCEINETQLNALFEKLKDKNKRPTRGKTLEIDRLIADKTYDDDINNLVLCCYMCNNAKSDFFDHNEFIPIGNAIKQVWQKILEVK